MPLWTPASISTALWLDASDSSTLYDATTGGSLVAADGAVARWEDKSGNGKHVTQVTAGNKPLRKTSIQNSLDVVRFDGTDDFLQAATASDWKFLHGTENASIYFVARIADTASPNAAVLPISTRVSGANNGWYYIWDDRTSLLRSQVVGAITYWGGALAVLNLSANNTLAGNTWALHGIKNDNNNATASERSEIRINGGPLINNNVNTPPTNNNDPAYALRLGGNSLYLPLDFGELVIAKGLHSTDTRQKVEGYLAWKWGLEANLPAGHPYKSAAPTVPSPNTRRRRYAGGYGL